MNEKVIQIDQYDRVVLYANGQIQLICGWNKIDKKIDLIVGGAMSITTRTGKHEPGIIRELKHEGLLEDA